MGLEPKEQQILEMHIPSINQLSCEGLETALSALPAFTMYQINAEHQKIKGKGQDALSMHELCRAERNICDYPNLLSYDIPHWQYQDYHFKNFNDVDELKLQELSDAIEVPRYYSKSPVNYTSQYNGDWIRLFIDNKFYYGNLYSAVHFILNTVEEKVHNWLNQKYPHQIQMNSYLCQDKSYKEPMYTVEFTTNNVLNSNASGELLTAYRHFENALRPELNRLLNTQTPATYIIYNVDDNGCPTVDLICKNDQTLSLIRPGRFVEDFISKTQNPAYLDFLASRYAKQAIDKILALGF
ncbi:hypothetical protein [Shewanella goraebulensis]|uniref:hypothetical protein n=1 Tax=Shewanella goraebulensis TaxID=3050637 RepID=UPI00254AB1D7|nr:hypothetical protein [Shewanella goraebulensis]